MSYYCTVRVGGHTWEFTSGSGEIEDALTVLQGLSFGWSNPSGLALQQPEPMRAAFAINVPEFLDAADIDWGTPVGVEFWWGDTPVGDPFATFYGRLTDATAQSRPGRSGVTLSVAAIDYTVDLVDVEPWAYGAAEDVRGYTDVITALFAARVMGTLPAWPFPNDGPTINTEDGAEDVAGALADILTASVTGLSRAILAPLIDSGGLTTQWFAFDVLNRLAGTDWTIHANNVRRDTIGWRRSRTSSPINTLFVTSPDYTTRVTWPVLGKSQSASLSTICSDADEVDDIAAFYLPSPPSDVAAWALDEFTVPLSKMDAEALAALPVDLMPRWYLDEGDPGRSSCYAKVVKIAGVPADLNPFDGATGVIGILDAATLTVTGRDVRLSARLREVYGATEDHRTGLMAVGGYATTPYAGPGRAT